MICSWAKVHSNPDRRWEQAIRIGRSLDAIGEDLFWEKDAQRCLVESFCSQSVLSRDLARAPSSHSQVKSTCRGNTVKLREGRSVRRVQFADHCTPYTICALIGRDYYNGRWGTSSGGMGAREGPIGRYPPSLLSQLPSGDKIGKTPPTCTDKLFAFPVTTSFFLFSHSLPQSNGKETAAQLVSHRVMTGSRWRAVRRRSNLADACVHASGDRPSLPYLH